MIRIWFNNSPQVIRIKSEKSKRGWQIIRTTEHFELTSNDTMFCQYDGYTYSLDLIAEKYEVHFDDENKVTLRFQISPDSRNLAKGSNLKCEGCVDVTLAEDNHIHPNDIDEKKYLNSRILKEIRDQKISDEVIGFFEDYPEKFMNYFSFFEPTGLLINDFHRFSKETIKDFVFLNSNVVNCPGVSQEPEYLKEYVRLNCESTLFTPKENIELYLYALEFHGSDALYNIPLYNNINKVSQARDFLQKIIYVKENLK